METLQTVWNIVLDFLKKDLGTIVFCIMVILIAWIFSKILCKLITKAVNKTEKIGDSVLKIITISVKTIVWIIVALIVICAFGGNNASVIAVFSALGLTFSLAVKDTLSNIIKGVQILITRPFKVGDFIEVEKVSGTVKTVEIIYTRLVTPDNKIILIPNNQVCDAKIINFSAEENRRLDLTFSISYKDNMDFAKSIIHDLIISHPLALNDPAPIVRVGDHGQNSIDLTVWVWVKGDDYFTLSFDLKEQVKRAFDKNKIEIPYPHMDINIINPNTLKDNA